MSYQSEEDSQSDGNAFELYKFQTDVGNLTQTSANSPIIFNLETYDPESISRTALSVDGGEDDPPTLRVTLPRSHPVPLRYIQSLPPDKDVITIFRGHIGAVTPAADNSFSIPSNQVVQYFEGFISTVEFSDSEAKLTLVASNSVFTRSIPKKNFRNLCNHLLYDGGCGVVEAPFQQLVTVTGITGNVLTLAGVPALGSPTPNPPQLIDGPYYDGGILTQAATGDTRMIQVLTRGATDDALLLFPFQSLGVGSILTLSPGCDHSIATCRAKFGNAPRYGGFPFVPTDNPFNKKLAD